MTKVVWIFLLRLRLATRWVANAKNDRTFFKMFQIFFKKIHKFSQIFKFFEKFLKNFMLCYTKVIFLLYNVSLNQTKTKGGSL